MLWGERHKHLIGVISIFFVALALLSGYVYIIGDEVTGMFAAGDDFHTLRAGQDVTVPAGVIALESVGLAEGGSAVLLFIDEKQQERHVLALGESARFNNYVVQLHEVYPTQSKGVHDRALFSVRDLTKESVVVAPYGGEFVLDYTEYAYVGDALVRVRPADLGVYVAVDDEQALVYAQEKVRIGKLLVEVIDFIDYEDDTYDKVTLHAYAGSGVMGYSFDAVVGDAFSVDGKEVVILEFGKGTVDAMVGGEIVRVPVGGLLHVTSGMFYVDHVEDFPGTQYDRVHGSLLPPGWGGY